MTQSMCCRRGSRTVSLGGTAKLSRYTRSSCARSCKFSGFLATRCSRSSADPRAGWGCAAKGSAIKKATMVRMATMLRMAKPAFLLQFILASCVLARADGLDERIRAAVEGFQGNVCLFAKNVDTGSTYGLRPDLPVRTASTIKLPILAATFTAVPKGKVKWTDFSTLRAADKVSGSGILGEFADGDQFTLAD